MTQWLRIFEHEIARRRRFLIDKPDHFKKIHSGNPKGLLRDDQCNTHCWVPATHLMIHDGASKSYKIGGIQRRAFIEANTYRKNGYQVVPQMCWRCDTTREKLIELISTTEREVRYKASRPRKPRGRKLKEPLESVFNELFE